MRLDGAGDFLRRWEYNAVRFLEREGYDVSYSDRRRHASARRRGRAAPHRMFLSVGHDEYWSSEMRGHVEAARDRGVHLAFLGADACYWQIRFEPGARGDADRTIVAYKEAAGDLDPLALDGRPQNDRLITGRWRDRPVSRPEERLIGVMYAADPVDADIVVSTRSTGCSPAPACSNGDALRGLLGYEVDAMAGDGPADDRPARVIRRSSIRAPAGTTRYADMTIYTADERRAGVRGRIDPVELGARRLQRAGLAHEPRQRSGAANHAKTCSTACCRRRQHRGRRRTGGPARS